MPRSCTVCVHAEREAINAALVAGETMRTIAHRTALSEDALKRHKKDHLPVTLTQAKEAAEVVHADDLLSQVRHLHKRAMTILDTAEEGGDLRAALLAIGQSRGVLELLAKLLGELDERPQLNVTLSAEWLSVRTVLLDALTPYPDARAAVAGRLLALEVSNEPRR